MLQLVENNKKMMAQNIKLFANFQFEFFSSWFVVEVFFDSIVDGII